MYKNLSGSIVQWLRGYSLTYATLTMSRSRVRFSLDPYVTVMKYADKYRKKKEMKSRMFAGEMRARSDSKKRCVEFSEGERRVIKLAAAGPIQPNDWSRAEHALGKLLQKSRVQHVKQVHVGPYTVDFLLPNKIAVEVEGLRHGEREERDIRRTNFLEQNGFFVLRIPARDAHKKETAELIKKICLERCK